MIEIIQNNPMSSSMVMAVVMVMLTVLVHYEVLSITDKIATRTSFMSHRFNIVFVVFGSFLAHTIEVWLYAGCYWLLVEAGVGSLSGDFQHVPKEYVYYSTVSYTSLGLGDVFPTGALRLLTGIEALNGLVLITWTASYTYLYMAKFWK